MTIIGDGKRYQEVKRSLESEFEEEIVSASGALFGANIVFINPKKKIESKSLGGVIPDGFFFDFNDANDPQFYIVEVELIEHSFFNHIFSPDNEILCVLQGYGTAKISGGQTILPN